MAKRRFNKYAHRQYMQSRLQGQPKGSQDGSNDADAGESCERIAREEASDASEPEPEPEPEAAGEASDPLESAGEAPPGEPALRMDFGDWARPRRGCDPRSRGARSAS